jgi:hypothetical protein
MIHLYGVAEDLEQLPEVLGLEDAPLERRHIEGLELVVSRVQLDRPEVSSDAVLRHAEVVEAVLACSRSMLPAQFGRAFADEEELGEAVRTKAPELKRSLIRVTGCVEFGLRVMAAPAVQADATEAGSGVAYMRARQAEAKERDRLSRQFHEPLARLSRESVRFSSGPAELLVSAYLVPSKDAEAFAQHVRRLETEHHALSVVCTGPWPPYTFAGDPQEGKDDPAA